MPRSKEEITLELQEACTDETGGPCPDGQWRRFAHEHAEDGYILSAV